MDLHQISLRSSLPPSPCDGGTEGGVLKPFASYLSDRGSSLLTIKSYLLDLAVFTRWFERENRQAFDIHLLTSTDLRAFREQSLQVELVMPTTWNRRLQTLRALARWAKEAHLIDHDPLRGVKRAADGRHRAPRSIVKPDLARLMRQLELDINAANTPDRRRRAVRDAALFGLMVYTGLREGEICRLRIADIEITERRGRVKIYNGKGEKFRDEPLGKETRYLVSEWLRQSGGAGEERLFPFLSPRAVQKRLKELCRRAGVEHISPHQLRHTFVKRGSDAGVPLPVLQQLAGHARAETTAQYAWPTWQDLEAAVDRIQVGM